MPTDRDRAVELARKVVREGELGVNLSLGDAQLLARELLRALGLPELLGRRREVLRMAHDDRRVAAENLAWGLGISFYLNEETGRISQHPPGLEIRAPKSARPFCPESSLPLGKDAAAEPS